MSMNEKIWEDTREEWGDIVYNIISQAEEIFAKCGAEDDFCLQHCSGLGNIVFGGFNRLIWSPMHGYYPDRSYCTKRFLEKWDEIYKRTN